MIMLLNIYRRLRVLAKQLLCIEPLIIVEASYDVEFHGSSSSGWCIPTKWLGGDSIIVDIGLGEDISFSESLIARYGCTVHGFDPTPRAINYVRCLNPRNFVLHEYGLGAKAGRSRFYLPNNASHVSGSLIEHDHVGQKHIDIELVTIREIFELAKAERISLLKLDIEGAEYDILDAADFKRLAGRVDILCIEFHHRWNCTGPQRTRDAVRTLNSLGFECAWRSMTTNEEFTFVNTTKDLSVNSLANWTREG